jgi:hypothetical protein
MRPIPAALVLLGALAAPACCLDLGRPYIDLRASIGGASGLDEVDSGGSSTDQDSRIGVQFAVEGIVRQRFTRLFGYCAGLGVFASGHAGEASDDHHVKLVYAAVGVELTAGLTLEPVHGLHLELRPFYRPGRGALEVDNRGSSPVQDETGDAGSYHALGVLLGGYYTFPFGLQLGAQVGGEDFTGHSRMDAGGATVSGDGGFARFVVGYSF